MQPILRIHILQTTETTSMKRIFTKKYMLIAFFSLFISIQANATYIYDCPYEPKGLVSDAGSVGTCHFLPSEYISTNRTAGVVDMSIDFTSRDVLWLIVLFGVYVVILRKKTNSRNANF